MGTNAPIPKRKRWVAVGLVAGALITIFGVRYYRDEVYQATPPPGNLTIMERNEVFNAFWLAANKQYPYFHEKGIDWTKVRRTSLRQIRQAPDDEAFNDVLLRAVAELHDTHVGLGIPHRLMQNVNLRLNMDGASVVIRAVIPNTDAAKLGLKPGMTITSVDDQPIAKVWQAEQARTSDSTEYGRRWRSARTVLLGKPGSMVKLGLMGLDGHPSTVELMRTSIGQAEEPAETKQLDGGIFYLKIATFNDGRATIRVAEALKTVASQKPKGLIIDMRGNGGGAIGDALNVADWLFAQETKVAYEKGAVSGTGEPAVTHPRGVAYEGPVLLLTDPGCVSACDIASTILSRLDRAKLVGEPPAGASQIAADIKLPKGYLIHLSGGADILGPDKQLIEGHPAKVAYPVAPTANDWAEGRDPVLNKAITLLK